MKIITLNTWGNRISGPCTKFFEHYSNTVEVFCLQEVYKNVTESRFNPIDPNQFENIEKKIKNFNGVFTPIIDNNWGLACFVRNTISLIDSGEILISGIPDLVEYESWSDVGRKMQWVKIVHEGKEYVIVNLHGYWKKDDKLDTPERIQQSEIILNFLKTRSEPIILCGDFNLMSDTQSIRMLEEAGLRNLIKEFRVTSTRTSHHNGKDKHADFIFLSQNVKLNEFRTLPEEVSDHAALFVDCE